MSPERTPAVGEGTQSRPLRRFVGLAVPNVLANLTVPLAGLVDTALLGHLPELQHLAGVGLAAVIFDYLYWSFGFLRMGTTGVTAQALGEGDEDEVVLTFARAVGLALILGVGIWVLAWPVQWLAFAVLDGSPAVEEAGRAYFYGRVVGAPLALANFAIIGSLLGRQRSAAVLWITAAGASTNVLLDAWFIWGLGWGSGGAGLATAASQLAMTLVGLAFLGRELRWRRISALRDRILDRNALARLASLSVDILVRTFALLTAFATFTNFSAALGTIQLGATTVLLKALSTAAFFIDGYAFAAESMAGLAKGRRAPRELRALLRVALPVGMVTGSLFATLFWFVPAVFDLLTDHTEVLSRVYGQRGWLAAVLLVSPLAYVLDGYFLGLAAGPLLRRAMLWSLGLGYLPLALYARYGHGSSALLWASMASFMLARALTLGLGVKKSFEIDGL